MLKLFIVENKSIFYEIAENKTILGLLFTTIIFFSVESGSKTEKKPLLMDEIDKKILQLLQENAKLTNKEIADKLGLSVTPVYERIKRLEKRQFIKAYVAIVDRKKVEKGLMAFLSVSLKEHSQKALINFQQEIMLFPKVTECYHIAGQYDFLLKILVKDMQDYHDFTFNRLASLDNIAHVQTDFVMNDLKYSTAIPIE